MSFHALSYRRGVVVLLAGAALIVAACTAAPPTAAPDVSQPEAPATSSTAPPSSTPWTPGTDVPSTTAAQSTTTATTAVPSTAPPSGHGALPSTRPVPAGAVWVTADGVDHTGCGAQRNAGCATVQYAYQKVAGGGAIAIGGGTYRGPGNVAWHLSKPAVTIIAEPGTQPVFQGTIDVPSTWTRVATTDNGTAVWHHAPLPRHGDGNPAWGASVDSGGFLPAGHPAWVDPGRPEAELAEQLWVNGIEQDQRVGDVAQLRAGEFAVAGDGTLHLASSTDPNTAEVQWAAYRKALRITGSGANTSIVGVTFERFASSNRDPDAYGSHAAVSVEHANGVSLTDVTIRDISGRGVYVGGNRPNSSRPDLDQPVRDVTFTRVSVERAGANALDAYLADGFALESSKLTGANHAGFAWKTTGPMSVHAALKATWSDNLRIVDSTISDTDAHGVWFDLYCNDAQISDTTITGNAGVGVFIEVSDGVEVTRSTVTANGNTSDVPATAGLPARGGILVAGSRNTEVTDTTFTANLPAHLIVVDDRDLTSPGRDTATPAEFPWEPGVRVDTSTFDHNTAVVLWGTKNPAWVEWGPLNNIERPHPL